MRARRRGGGEPLPALAALFADAEPHAPGALLDDAAHVDLFNYEEADVGALPRRLEEVAALPQTRIVPGHGAPGGRELLERQRAYHRDVAAIVRGSPTPGAARAAILARFPGLALEEAVESAVVAHAPARR